MTAALLLLMALPAQADSLFALGADLVTEGDTAGAVAAWQGAAATGWTSAALEHNLGTVALARGDVGRARLHLERAARLDPLDADVARNVALARERAGERPRGVGRRTWDRAVAVVRPLGLVLLALALAFGALGTMLLGRRRVAVGVAVVAAVAVAVATVAVWQTTRPLGVALSDVSVAEEPASSTGGVARLSPGDVLEVGLEVEGWRPVRVGRARGWVRADAVEAI